MTDRDGIAEALADVLRPMIGELVAEEVERQLSDLAAADEGGYWTTSEYATEHRTTPGAVLARITRGTLYAVRPPGSRQWLIPRGERQRVTMVATVPAASNAPAARERSGADTEERTFDA